MPRLFPSRPAFWATGALGAAVLAGLVWGTSQPNPTPAHQPPAQQGAAVGIGGLMEGAKGVDAGAQAYAAAAAHAAQELPGAPDSIKALATRLFMGQTIASNALEGIDPHLFTYVFHAPHSLDTGGGSLAREAAALGRIDALHAMAEAGASTQADGGLLFWATLEHWDGAQGAHGRAILQKAALEEGVHRDHEDGFTAFELAATVSMDAVAALIQAGANPWTHPGDPQEAFGFPSVMERLSLHAGAPGAMEMITGVIALPALPVPSERARWNTVGNLIDSAIILESEGQKAPARRAIALAISIEDRFGAVPAHFWSQAARDLRPADAPALDPLTTPEDALANIPMAQGAP